MSRRQRTHEVNASASHHSLIYLRHFVHSVWLSPRSHFLNGWCKIHILVALTCIVESRRIDFTKFLFRPEEIGMSSVVSYEILATISTCARSVRERPYQTRTFHPHELSRPENATTVFQACYTCLLLFLFCFSKHSTPTGSTNDFQLKLIE